MEHYLSHNALMIYPDHEVQDEDIYFMYSSIRVSKLGFIDHNCVSSRCDCNYSRDEVCSSRHWIELLQGIYLTTLHLRATIYAKYSYTITDPSHWTKFRLDQQTLEHHSILYCGGCPKKTHNIECVIVNPSNIFNLWYSPKYVIKT